VNNKPCSIVVTAALAVLGTACAADYGELESEGEGAVDSIQQALPTSGMRMKVTLGENGLDSGEAYAEVRYMGYAPKWYELNDGEQWEGYSSHTVDIQLHYPPERVYDVFLRYGKGEQGDHSDYWDVSGFEIWDIRNAALSTKRFNLGWDIVMSPTATFAYLPLPIVLQKTPITPAGSQSENYYIAYKTWNGGKYCASVKGIKFTHATWSAAYGCNWHNAHEATYMDYLSKEGNAWIKWRANVDTATMRFTHTRMDTPPNPPSHSSANLRYKAVDDSYVDVVMKPWPPPP